MGPQIIKDARLRIQDREVLVKHRDPLLRPVRLARDRIEQARRDPQQRRLARTIGPGQRNALRPVDPQCPRAQPTVSDNCLHPVQREHPRLGG